MRPHDEWTTAEAVRRLLDYDPVTGWLTWRDTTGFNSRKGRRAGGRHVFGYRRIRVGQIDYLEHRVVWLHVYGCWPSALLDHVNRVKDDNRIENLREADDWQNKGNRACRKEGVRCVPSGRFKSEISVKGRYYYIGTFDTREEAAAAYRGMALKLRGEFAPNEYGGQ